MPCCFNKQFDLYTVDSTALCEKCGEEFYQARYKQLRKPYQPGEGMFSYVTSVWMDRIETVFRGIDIQTKEKIYFAINPYYNKCNVNERPINQVDYILYRFNEPKRKEIIIELYTKVNDSIIHNHLFNRFLFPLAKDNFDAAKDACETTRKILSRGVGNWTSNLLDSRNFRDHDSVTWLIHPMIPIGRYLGDNLQRKSELLALRKGRIAKIKAMNISSPIENIRKYTEVFVNSKIGNCGEHGAIAFLHIFDNHKSARSLKWVEMIVPDHAFVVIGDDLSNWVICDAYFDEVYLLIDGRKGHHTSSDGQYPRRIEVNKYDQVVYYHFI